MNDDGFTYPELLISLVITGLVSFLLIGIFFSYSGFVVKGRESNQASRQTLLTYYFLKDEIGRVRPDWRKDSFPYVHSGKEFRFTGYKGSDDSLLILRNGRDSLRIVESTGGTESVLHSLKGVNIEKVAPLYFSGLIYALQLEVLVEERKEIFILPLSTIPVKRSDP